MLFRFPLPRPFLAPIIALLAFASIAFGKTVDLTEDVWRFQLGDTAAARQADFDDSRWSRVSLPHTWNALDAQDGKPRTGEFRSSGYRRTAAWYRQEVEIPEYYQGQRSYIRGEGASLVKHVYVNGHLVGTHAGAFTAFCFEITDWVTPGEPAMVVIRVDNSQDPSRSSYELDLESGRKTLNILPLRGDFNLYGGIYRDLELILKPSVAISPTDYASSGVYVTTPEVSADRATVRVETVLSVAGDAARSARLSARLFNVEGELVAESEAMITASDAARSVMELSVDRPRLWQGVADPYLYDLEVSVSSDGAIDRVHETIGIREILFDPARGFVLNGELLRLRGVNRHQDWKDKGWAIGPEQHATDFKMIQEIGANAVRLAHYPQDPYVLELCDRLGLIVLMEIPLVGWVTDDEAFTENTKSQLREMIHQYYNHPSLPTWGLWNELAHRAPDYMPSPIPLVQELQAIVALEDPYRPTVGSANDSSDAAPGLRDITEVLTWNLYPGWYGESQADAMADWLEERRERDGRAVIGVSEYGAGASIYQHEDWSDLQQPVARSPWHPEEYQAYFHERTWRAIANDPKVWGSFVWNMFDFAADHRDEGDRPGINDKGLVTHDRRVRKDAFFFYQASWTDEPVVHITSRRFSPRPAGTATIKVYSNLSDLQLTVDGKDLGPGQVDGVVHLWEDVALAPGQATVVAMGKHGDEVKTDRIIWEVEAPARYATLKFDDMRPDDDVGGVTAIEQAVYEQLMGQGIPHAWGVCRLYQSDNPAFYDWLRARDAEGVEIWHHGNRHDRIEEAESWEFRNRDEASQLDNLRYTQQTILERTGIVLRTFGAPYNKTDEATGRALNRMEALEIMYFGQQSPNFEGRMLNDRVNLEARTGVVAELEDFKAAYAEKEEDEMIVLQGHPVYWDSESDLAKLQAILDFLKKEGRIFITPKGYHSLKENSAPKA